MMRRSTVCALLMLLVLGAFGCGGERFVPGGADDDEGSTYEPPSGDEEPGEPQVPQPEAPQVYTYSSPAIVGDRVYVANRTLNAVAIIDSASLEVSAVPVGSEPNQVVAPAEGAGDEGRVMVLNSGDATVSVLNPQGGASRHWPVLPRANRLQATA